MLSSVTLNSKVTMIVMNSGSQLSEMTTISHVFVIVLAFVFGQVLPPHHAYQMSQRSQLSRIALGKGTKKLEEKN